ncbi:MAG: helix-turn-helix transcriptional regulator [Clostridia bacterium]|nr:helix-turn-helix transcriptional regulator [Clostridia bacterium]
MAYRHHRSAPLFRVQDLVTIHYYEIDADYRFEGESHPFWEIVYVNDGAIHARNGDADWNASAGELLFHAPDTFHLAEGNGTDQGHIFIISFSCRSAAMEQFRDLKLRLPSNLKNLISGIMLEANNFYDMEIDGLYPLPNAPQGGDQMIRLYLEQLLIQLYRSRTAHTVAPKPQDLLSEMILYLNSRVYDTLSLPELCAHLHYGKTFLSGHFKAETGKSIMQYYRSLKINEAKRLLHEQALTVSEISDLLCFDTPQYFSRVFKAEIGETPGEYRSGTMH